MTPKSPKSLALATLAVQGGEPVGRSSPVVPPLVQAVSFVQDIGTADGLRHQRYGTVPNAEAVQRRVAQLEGAEAACLLASGMGATVCALLALLRPGDHLLASSWLYGGARQLLTQEFGSFGINVSLVDPLETRVWRKRLRKETRAIFLETPVNPTGRVLDLRPVSYIAQELGIALVVDSSFASPINFRALEHGADVVVHSATKYLNGHHDAMGGVVCGSETYVDEVRAKMTLWGQAPDPFACWLIDRGLKTLDVRMRRHNENAARIAAWAEGCKAIRAVHYPGLESHPDHAVAMLQQTGFGGMVGLEVVGGARAAERAIRRMRLFRNAPSLGGVDSLVCEPRLTSHAAMTTEERAKIGIPDGFIRLSVGIEDADDLVADLAHAFRP